MYVYVRDIEWDVDEEDIENEVLDDLPDRVGFSLETLHLSPEVFNDEGIPDNDALNEAIGEFLSEKYGFCHFGFSYHLVKNNFERAKEGDVIIGLRGEATFPMLVERVLVRYGSKVLSGTCLSDGTKRSVTEKSFRGFATDFSFDELRHLDESVFETAKGELVAHIEETLDWDVRKEKNPEDAIKHFLRDVPLRFDKSGKIIGKEASSIFV